jgi:hypothetical protein
LLPVRALAAGPKSFDAFNIDPALHPATAKIKNRQKARMIEGLRQ